MLPTNISKEFEVGDLLKCTVVEEVDDPHIYFLLLENMASSNPFARNRWRILDMTNGEIKISYMPPDMWEKVT